MFSFVPTRPEVNMVIQESFWEEFSCRDSNQIAPTVPYPVANNIPQICTQLLQTNRQHSENPDSSEPSWLPFNSGVMVSVRGCRGTFTSSWTGCFTSPIFRKQSRHTGGKINQFNESTPGITSSGGTEELQHYWVFSGIKFRHSCGCFVVMLTNVWDLPIFKVLK